MFVLITDKEIAFLMVINVRQKLLIDIDTIHLETGVKN